ncbi:cytochrome c [Alloacidobacterium dinghuense]|uniref:Cytochrome c n=1 Tax=Alloacidobacterium dinghuense TaxID=2763107 RepID=A0A7G8BIS5_9BACT|nr:cytochrome c [Alloacidobacterium dinghuense]QNI32445.1 cytochrome c [Alloacidobacterium dinghuense]
MMNCLRMFTVPRNLMIAALGALVFLTAGPAARSQTAPSTDAAGTFKSKCAVCHGADGAGTALGTRMHAPDLRSKEVQDQTPEALTKVITSGKNNMPAFGNRLDKDQIQKLVDYVKTLHTDSGAK